MILINETCFLINNILIWSLKRSPENFKREKNGIQKNVNGKKLNLEKY